ncbi:MAG: hypothetical protein ABW185_18155 [Sedimenticola sp.]
MNSVLQGPGGFNSDIDFDYPNQQQSRAANTLAQLIIYKHHCGPSYLEKDYHEGL